MEGAVTADEAGSDTGPHLELYGGVWWEFRRFRWAAPAGRPTTILVLLAAADGATVSPDSLVDHLWAGDPPASGLNALRRHISRVRSQFRQRFDDPPDPIIREAAGYRLAPEISTDLDLMKAAVSGDIDAPSPGTTGAPRWWEEPLAGLPWEPFVMLRARLSHLARDVCVSQAMAALEDGRHLLASRMLEAMSASFPNDRELWILTVETARRSEDQQTIDRLLQRLQHTAEEFDDDELRALAASLLADRVARVRSSEPDSTNAFDRAATEWLMGHRKRAVDIVTTSRLEPDTAVRLERIFAGHDPSDGLVRLLLSEMVGTWRTHRPSAERALISLDARRPTAVSDPTDPIWHSTEGGTTHERVRSLRAEFFARLALPLHPRVFDIVGELGEIGSNLDTNNGDAVADAAVEAVRFDLVLAARQGRFGDAIQLLDDYDRVAADRWPLFPCGFGNLSRLVFAMHPELDGVGLDFNPPNHFMEMATERAAAELALIHHRLVTERLEPASTLDVLIGNAENTLDPQGVVALRLFRQVASGLIADARDAALVATTGPLVVDQYRHYLPTAVATVAIAAEDKALGSWAFRQLEPFADEQLGCWPLDLLLGSAERLLDRLDQL